MIFNYQKQKKHARKKRLRITQRVKIMLLFTKFYSINNKSNCFFFSGLWIIYTLCVVHIVSFVIPFCRANHARLLPTTVCGSADFVFKRTMAFQ